ncbi:hypothetical protein B0H19DRAFT_1128702 [Mycena capillaripes]|nr:hypothetical protein B0H19DRAFT_1128702 [Mycena capillaripes]
MQYGIVSRTANCRRRCQALSPYPLAESSSLAPQLQRHHHTPIHSHPPRRSRDSCRHHCRAPINKPNHVIHQQQRTDRRQSIDTLPTELGRCSQHHAQTSQDNACIEASKSHQGSFIATRPGTVNRTRSFSLCDNVSTCHQKHHTLRLLYHDDSLASARYCQWNSAYFLALRQRFSFHRTLVELDLYATQWIRCLANLYFRLWASV